MVITSYIAQQKAGSMIFDTVFSVYQGGLFTDYNELLS